MSDYIGPEGGAPEAEAAVPTPAGAGGELARITAGVRRVVTVPVSGPAPANGAAFVTFANQGVGTWTSADIPVGSFDELAIDFDVTAIVATGTAQLLIDRKDAAGIYRNIVTAVAKCRRSRSTQPSWHMPPASSTARARSRSVGAIAGIAPGITHTFTSATPTRLSWSGCTSASVAMSAR